MTGTSTFRGHSVERPFVRRVSVFIFGVRQTGRRFHSTDESARAGKFPFLFASTLDHDNSKIVTSPGASFARAAA
jgi:hypothetical protein